MPQHPPRAPPERRRRLAAGLALAVGHLQSRRRAVDAAEREAQTHGGRRRAVVVGDAHEQLGLKVIGRAHRADACLKDTLELTAAAAHRLLHHALDHLDRHLHPRRKVVGAAPEDERVSPPHGARSDAQRVPPARARVRQRS